MLKCYCPRKGIHSNCSLT